MIRNMGRMIFGSLRDDWSSVASALTPDGRVMFVDDGHRASHELVKGPGVLDERLLRELCLGD
jgi:hypothetical protein